MIGDWCYYKPLLNEISDMMICLNRLRKCSKWYRLPIVLFVFIYFGPTYLYAQKQKEDKFDKKSLVGKQKDESYIVPTSQIIDPAGTTITFPGRPMDIALNRRNNSVACLKVND